MKEIEIKIQIADAARVRTLLEKSGCVFSASVHQLDVVYVPVDQSVLPVPPGTNVLRIRQQEGKTLLTLKRSDPKNHLAKTEKELEIKDVSIMEDIISLLGFHEISRVDKERRTCKYQGCEVCIDQVKDLGSFLELEKITDEDPGAVQEAMLGLLRDLGIDVSQRMAFGYDVLMYQKNGTGN